jgi:uncharacterized damage-inducible protein DinB
MATDAVQQYLYLFDQAFEGSRWHSLLGNLASVSAEEWTMVPSGGRRSIRHLVQHVGGSSIMYENHSFGDASLRWDSPAVDGRDVLLTPSAATEWLREGHARLRERIAALDDAELTRPRRTYWGTMPETRWGMSVMIEHDLYHAGEINHVRALLQNNDG